MTTKKHAEVIPLDEIQKDGRALIELGTVMQCDLSTIGKLKDFAKAAGFTIHFVLVPILETT